MGEAIDTARLHLRPPRAEDAEPLNALIQDPRVYRNVGRIPPNAPLQNTREFIERTAASRAARTGLSCLIFRDGELIGTTGGGDGGRHGPFDVGYWITPPAWGQGYATEAFTALLAWLQSEWGLKAVTAGYFVDNPASGRVLRKAGFLPAGRRLYPCLGRECDVECIDMGLIF
ncbi:MAG: GNAT family N-acetyltransferase [Pseudomonadota bacterium]